MHGRNVMLHRSWAYVGGIIIINRMIIMHALMQQGRFSRKQRISVRIIIRTIINNSKITVSTIGILSPMQMHCGHKYR